MTSRKINYIQTGQGIPLYADSINYQEYRIQKGDRLFISLFSPDENARSLFNERNTTQQNSSALTTYQVYEDGTISFPYIGTISVVSNTTREVKFLLEQKLMQLLPSVSVNVYLSNRTFSLIGEAGSGRFPMPKEKINIFQALAICGDLSSFSDRKKIQIIRQTEDGTKVFDFDIRSKSIINSEFYYIQPNDVIYVPFVTEKAFGITHATNVISTTMTTLSFLMTLINIGVLIKKAAK